MNPKRTALLGVGNILEGDDGIAVYATAFLEANYSFVSDITIINGGVEGINLLDVFIEHDRVVILDAIDIEDAPGSIYHIPAAELSGYGLGSGGAHEVGVMQCIDMLILMDKPVPESSVVGIVPQRVEVGIGLSETLADAFDRYIATVLQILGRSGVEARPKRVLQTQEQLIEGFRSPTRI